MIDCGEYVGAFLGMPSGMEWIIPLLLVLIFFGASRLPKVARSMGEGIREFKKSLRGGDKKELEDQTEETPSDE